jgi:hypothetical protein
MLSDFSQRPLIVRYDNRPTLTVKIWASESKHPETVCKVVSVSALIDTGATTCYCPPKFLKKMGHIPEEGEESTIVGVRRQSLPVRKHTCTIQLANSEIAPIVKPFTTAINFPDPHSDQINKKHLRILNHPSSKLLLGQSGFFNRFIFALFEPTKTLHLYPHKSLLKKRK